MAMGWRSSTSTLAETERINDAIRGILDVHLTDWGVQIPIVELRDIQLPESMKRALARGGGGTRERRCSPPGGVRLLGQADEHVLTFAGERSAAFVSLLRKLAHIRDSAHQRRGRTTVLFLSTPSSTSV